MDARSLHPRLPFAELLNVDISALLAADPVKSRRELQHLLSTHGLIVFRGVKISPQEEVQLSELCGYHKRRDSSSIGAFGGWNAPSKSIATIPSHPDVLCQGNVKLEAHHGIASAQLQPLLTYENEGFHSDGVHNMQEHLPVVTSMYCLKAPVAGGETFFACSRLALSRLDPTLQELCRRLDVHYEYIEGDEALPIMRDGIVRVGRQPAASATGERKPPIRTIHPLVRVHADTGEESLYISCGNIDHMHAAADDFLGVPGVLLDAAASYELVQQLLGEVTQAPLLYAHKWRSGDLALFDNRLLMHAPMARETCVGERLHHRVRLDGSADANRDLIEFSVRRDLAAAHTLSHHFGFDELTWNHISARVPATACVTGTAQAPTAASYDDKDGFLVTPGDRMFDEVTARNLTRSSPDNVNVTADVIHAAIYEARPDVHAIVHHHTPCVVAVACLKEGLQLLTQDAAAFVDRVAYHDWEGVSDGYDEKSRIAAALGPTAHTLLMRHHGAVTTGATVAEAWVRYYYLDRICQVQCQASAKPCRQPTRAVLVHSSKQLGPGALFAHGKFEWKSLLRLATSLQAERAHRRAAAAGARTARAAPVAELPACHEDDLRSLEKRGFCVIDDVIPLDEVAAVRDSVLRMTAMHRNPKAPPTIGHVPGLIRHDQSFAPYLASPKILSVVEAVFGANAKITFTTGQTNHPGCVRQEWHADWPFAQTGSAHIPAPYANAICHMTVLLMLDEMNEQNGTILLPGSHQSSTNPTVAGVMSDPMAAHPQEIRATGAVGSVLLIDSRLWHAIPPNPTNLSRVAVAVRYAPWWLDTSVVMPGSAARLRIVDGIGRPLDAGAAHAGIPLGNPSQPPIPPHVHAELVAKGGNAQHTAAMYEHWLPPATQSPMLRPAELSASPPSGSPPSVADTTHASIALRQSGYCVLAAAYTGNGHSQPPTTVAALAAKGFLTLPSVLALAKASLGDFVRICDVQSDAWKSGTVLACAWPHAPELAPCVSTPPLSRLHEKAALVLNAFIAHEACTLLVQPMDVAASAPAVKIALFPGDVVMLHSRVPFRWAAASERGCAVSRVSYSPWWFDASVLSKGSLHRDRVEAAFEAGLGSLPPPPRPALNLRDVVGEAMDLLQHWEVESTSSGRSVATDSTSADHLEGSRLDLLGTYGRIWVLQQLLQCGAFDLMAQALAAGGPEGMGRSFMAAKVRTDPRAAYLLPIFFGATWWPNAPLLLLAHAANIWLHASRAPFIWDHELWDMLTEFVMVVGITAHMIEQHTTPKSEYTTNRIIARCAPAVRLMMIIFYAAAAFWKLNSSFFDPIASCAPVFIMQLIAAYVPDGFIPFARTDFVTQFSPHVATVVEFAIPTLLSQGAKRPSLCKLGLGLGLLFHFLIALTPPPNNAGGFSVGAIVRYFFFMPLSTAAAAKSLSPRSLIPTTLSSGAAGRIGALAAILLAVGIAASDGKMTLAGSLPVFIALLFVYARSLYLGFVGTTTTVATSAAADNTAAGRCVRQISSALVVVAAIYAFGLPVLGLQDMAACNMFANLHGPTAVFTGANHYLVPCGLLQARYEHASAATNPLAGGVVEVLHSTSDWMRELYPAESTRMISLRAREMLHHAGHSGREFGPSTTRVVGTLPGMRPDPKDPQLTYLLPALELRRLLAEARDRAESFTVTYRRVSRTNAPFAGRVVDVVDRYGSSGMRHTTCMIKDGGKCDDDELAMLPASSVHQWWWLTGLLLSFPLPMREDGVRELGCLA